MRELYNTDRLALMQVANYDCMKNTDDCRACPYFAHVESTAEDFDGGCISIYLKQIVDKYYTHKGE